MTDPYNLLAILLNGLMVLALAAILVSPMVVFYAALAATPAMIGLLIFITMTPRAQAPAAIRR